MKKLPNLLIVDDIETNLFLLTSIINGLELNLISALSGVEALKKTAGLELALAIIDVRMPNMSGYELALKLNEERNENKVPIIFLTANYFNDAEMFKGYEAGAVDFLFKPFAKAILISKINVFLDLHIQKQTIAENSMLLKKSEFELNKSNLALQKSEKKYRSYIDNAPDGIFVSDDTGKIIEVNEAVCRITGYTRETLLSLSVSELVSEEMLEEGLAHFRKRLKKQALESDLMFRHFDGTNRWWSMEVVKLSQTRFIGFVKDITDSKKAQEELKNSLEQLRLLTQHVEKVREDERGSISRELHDQLGQSLTAVTIELGIIRQMVGDSDVLVKVNKVSALVTETIKSVQRLTAQLRPEIIVDLGLVPAIEWYTMEFEQRTGIEILLDWIQRLKFLLMPLLTCSESCRNH
jgi:PAS domain S-box-containing protein